MLLLPRDSSRQWLRAECTNWISHQGGCLVFRDGAVWRFRAPSSQAVMALNLLLRSEFVWLSMYYWGVHHDAILRIRRDSQLEIAIMPHDFPALPGLYQALFLYFEPCQSQSANMPTTNVSRQCQRSPLPSWHGSSPDQNGSIPSSSQ